MNLNSLRQLGAITMMNLRNVPSRLVHLPGGRNRRGGRGYDPGRCTCR